MDSIVFCGPAFTLTPFFFKVYFFFLYLQNKVICLPSKVLGIKDCLKMNMSLRNMKRERLREIHPTFEIHPNFEIDPHFDIRPNFEIHPNFVSGNLDLGSRDCAVG
jgi:hypothetical protein